MRALSRWFCLAALFVIAMLSTMFILYTAVLWSADARRPLSVSREHLERLIRQSPAPLPQIPKIIHQTWKNATVPERWREAHDSCLAKHPVDAGWEHRLWTDESAREFVEATYPDLLATFDSYPYNIQRADSMRYMILHHFGGIYIDLDIGCLRSLEPLLAYPAVLPNTNPVGFSNDFLMARPGHPFFLQVSRALSTWNHWYPGPWLTIFFSTGPPFMSLQYVHYMHSLDRALLEPLVSPLHPDLVYNMEGDLYGSRAYFFRHYTGSSWHHWDVAAVMLIWNHMSLLNVALFMAVLAAVWYVCTRFMQLVFRHRVRSPRLVTQ